MKKTSKFLSMILALAMVFALAVPAFAEYEEKHLTLEDVNFSVDPIGVATIKGEIEIDTEWYQGSVEADYENVYVFDQDCVATLKDGRGIEFIGLSEILYGTGNSTGLGWDGELPQDYHFSVSDHTDAVYFFGVKKTVEDEVVGSEACYMVTKAHLDELTAAGLTVTITPLGQPSKPAAPAVKPAPGVSVPLNDGTGEFAYTIKYGDSLSKLAAFYYGDMNVYKLIFERNKDVLKNANTIYAGQVITLPSYAAVAEFKAPAQPEQKPADTEKPEETQQPEKPAAVKPAPGVSVPLNDGTGEFAYTVKYGDSLSRIAAYYYGDVNVYKLIFERNKDTVKNANTIYAGQVITLPSYAAVAEFQAAAK